LLKDLFALDIGLVCIFAFYEFTAAFSGRRPPIGRSDHLVVEFTVSVNLQVNSTSNNPSADDVKYQWYRADFDSLSIYVYAVDWMTAVYHNPNARNMWTFFMNTFTDGINCLYRLTNYVTI